MIPILLCAAIEGVKCGLPWSAELELILDLGEFGEDAE